MVDSKNRDIAAACPRCGTAHTRVIARSPVEGVWEISLCSTCFYSWRSTEPAYATTPEGITPGFRVDPATLPLGKVMPAVPPLRDAACGGVSAPEA
jgi:hypothetical protein